VGEIAVRADFPDLGIGEYLAFWFLSGFFLSYLVIE